MSLSDKTLRAVVNMLAADEGSAGNAARILAAEAKERGVLVADLIAKGLAPPSALATASAQPSPGFHNVDEDDLETAIWKRLNAETFGLRALVVHETDRAWLVALKHGREEWLPKSQCEHHGEDRQGRAIIIVPAWLVRKKGLTP